MDVNAKPPEAASTRMGEAGCMSGLEELAARWRELAPGEEYPVEGNSCRHCGSGDLVLVVKLEATGGALAGMQMKVSAKAWPYLRCRGCKHESRGTA
jgi:hypothetical protein